ncbi:hypothetical protein XA68_10727 [Ophiocordyceps unilateralis]|uniref:CFEM domain-containing protein n=1 Tax=Ophiocordyceps unilateralis TaxID=268505 RepID=A0A2A9PRA5_OPHUN|nr:hypothetical protein XA68_10727 [Ophiocordyceps unilateralis]
MGRLAPLVAIAVLAVSQAAAQNTDTPPCIPECANQVRSDFAKFSCQNANDATCLCNKDNFSFGVRDCGAHCGANDDNVRRFLLGSFCAGVFSTQSPSQAQATPTTSATLSSATSSSPTSTQPSSTPASSTTQQTSSSPTVASSTQAALTSSSTTSASETSSGVADVPPSATSTQAEVSGSTTGPSQASVIGIGVGVGAAVVALAGLVICLMLRGRKQKPRQSMEISKPLPGSGRAYAGRERNSFEKHGNDIEMTSHRYEDMVPRQQPRTMV